MYGSNLPLRSRFVRLLTLSALACGLTATHAAPAWWAAGSEPVTPTGATVNNHGAANVGQAKWMATRAFETLSGILGEDAPEVIAIKAELFKLTETATTGVFYPVRPATPSAEWLAAQKAPLQVGALKALAAPFYKHLSGYDATWLDAQLLANGLIKDDGIEPNPTYFTDTDGTLYPWNPANNSDSAKNKSAANIGQLKLAFSLDFATLTPPGPGFLVQPADDSTHLLEDGVPIGLDIEALGLSGSTLPEKVDVFVRPAGGSDPWQQVGRITEFQERYGVKFFRGGAVWVPEEAGEYEVEAKAYGASDTLLATTTREITVEGNHVPDVVINNLPSLPYPDPSPVMLDLILSDEDPGDEVRRVEFRDNGILIATDSTGPNFEDDVQSVMLMKGSHSLRATAYDRYGASDLSNHYSITVTGGESRPTLAITSPADGSTVGATSNLVISLTTTVPDGGTDAVNHIEATVTETSATTTKTTGPFTSITIPSANLQTGPNTVTVFVRDNDSIESYPLTLQVTKGNFANDLAQKIGGNASAVITNAKYTGKNEASAIFDNEEELGAPGVEVVDGVNMLGGTLLTTGRAEYWDDNDSSEEKEARWNSPGDPKLQDRIVGDTTEDAAVLEFDVACTNSQLELELQFGSEEYLEYVGNFNDAFLVTVDNAVMNLVPDGAEIIAVNSIHSGTMAYPAVREELFVNNDDLTGSLKVEYDGMTVRLRLHAFVTPGETHHVRIAIADVDDARLDSGLFLEAGSLKTVDPTD